MLNAAEILKRENRKDIVFTFIGDGKMKNKLIEIADTKNLDNCFFLPPMPKFLLADYLKGSTNIGLMILKNIPAFYEGTSPNKFFDYISSGLPVLINYPGWISETIKKYNMGISVNPESPSEFANAIKKIADNKLLQTKMGKSSREVAVEFFSSNDLSDKFLNILEDTYKKYNSRKNNYLKIFFIFLKTTFDKMFAFFLFNYIITIIISTRFLVKINLGTPIFFKQLRPGLEINLFHL